MARKNKKRGQAGAQPPQQDPRAMFGAPQPPRQDHRPASSTPLADYLARPLPGVDPNYVVVPRSLAEGMSLPWQQQLVNQLAQFHTTHGGLSWPVYKVVPSRQERLVDLDEDQLAEAGYLVEIDADGELVYRERNGRKVEDPDSTTILVSCLDPIPSRESGLRRLPPVGPSSPSVHHEAPAIQNAPQTPAPMNIGPAPVWRAVPQQISQSPAAQPQQQKPQQVAPPQAPQQQQSAPQQQNPVQQSNPQQGAAPQRPPVQPQQPQQPQPQQSQPGYQQQSPPPQPQQQQPPQQPQHPQPQHQQPQHQPQRLNTPPAGQPRLPPPPIAGPLRSSNFPPQAPPQSPPQQQQAAPAVRPPAPQNTASAPGNQSQPPRNQQSGFHQPVNPLPPLPQPQGRPVQLPHIPPSMPIRQGSWTPPENQPAPPVSPDNARPGWLNEIADRTEVVRIVEEEDFGPTGEPTEIPYKYRP